MDEATNVISRPKQKVVEQRQFMFLGAQPLALSLEIERGDTCIRTDDGWDITMHHADGTVLEIITVREANVLFSTLQLLTIDVLDPKHNPVTLRLDEIQKAEAARQARKRLTPASQE